MLVLLLSALACRPAAVNTPDDTGPCAEAPVLSWENFGESFVTQYCQSCHASTSNERYGAPGDVVFDTEEDVWAQADRMLFRAGGDAPTMPPEGGIEAADRKKLEWWLSCN